MMTDAPTTTSAVGVEGYTQLHDDNGGSNTQQRVSPASSDSVPKLSPSPSRSLRKSRSSRKRKRIVFASASKYQWLIALLVVTPLVAILMSIILFDVQSQEEYKNSSTIWILGWCFLLLTVVYMAVLPRQVDVRADGRVAIKTCLLTFFIDDIARAYRGCTIESDYDSLLRPRVMLATTLNKDGAVVIRRHHRKWDVVVTPEDPDGFIDAIEGMLRKKEDEATSVEPVGQKRLKPNLASTTMEQPV